MKTRAKDTTVRAVPRACSIVMGAIAAVAIACALLTPAARAQEYADSADSGSQSAAVLESAHPAGYVSVDKDFYHAPAKRALLRGTASNGLPSAYRSDTQPWACAIKVKDQGQSGLCWAFSMTSTAEYSYAKEHSGKADPAVETSPGHLGYFMFNRTDDPLGNTAGDRNAIKGTDGGSDAWPVFGSNQILGMQHLATWSGLGAETNTPFESILDCYSGSTWKAAVWNTSDARYPDSSAYDDCMILQNSVVVDLPEAESERDVLTNANTVKELVYKYGAVSASIEMDVNQYMNTAERIGDTAQTYSNGRSYYKYDKNGDSDHAVTVVGWDDDYPKENFSHGSEETTPPGDGAWVVQNSWGEDAHENGFFYASYYTCGLTNDERVFAFDMQPASAYAYNFQYDGTADCGDASDSGNESFETVEGTKAANVFTNTTGGPVRLEAVGFTTYNADRAVQSVDVYTSLSDPYDPTSGIHAGTTRVVTDSAGCKTAALDKPVCVGAGETYALVFSFDETEVFFGVERDRDDAYYDYSVQTDPGQSFFLGEDADIWTDMNVYQACFRIKGFANAVDSGDAHYTVVFEDGLGNIIDTQDVAAGQAAVLPAQPTREGYAFVGWSADCTSIIKNTVAEAQWEKTVVPTTIAKAKVALSRTSYTYNGAAKRPSVTAVVLNGTTLMAGTDYTVSYKNNVKAGEATVVVTGCGAYTGSATAVFTIKPKKVTSLCISRSSATAAKVSWAKVGGASGYQVQWRIRGGSWRTENVEKPKTVVKKLKVGRLYDLRVRGVAGSVKSPWSKVCRCYFRSVSAVKATSSKRATVKVKWKNDAKANKGYRVTVRYAKNGAVVASKNVKATKRSVTLKGLKRGKKAWVQVTALRKAGGKTYVGVVKGCGIKVKVA